MGFFVFTGFAVALLVWWWRSSGDIRGNPLPTEMVGLQGTARETFALQGTVLVRGEIWRATPRSGIIQRGDIVSVTAMGDGLLLEVERIGPQKNDQG